MTMVPGSEKINAASNEPGIAEYMEAKEIMHDLMVKGKQGYLLMVTFGERDAENKAEARTVFTSVKMSPAELVESVAENFATVMKTAQREGLLGD